MNKCILFIFIGFFLIKDSQAQHNCMYHFDTRVDIPLAALGVAGTGYGLYKRFKKPPSDTATILALSNENMNRWDKGATQSYNKGRISDALFVLGVTSPWILYADEQIKKDKNAITMMYIQAIGLSAAGYALTAGTIDKYRPYAYNSETPLKRRLSTHAKNSFYCGHPSVMAAGSFFTAKTYSDYYPNTFKSYALWSYATLSTIACGYLRYKGGYHFPSDIIIGMAAGTAIGILVPTLHKNRKEESHTANGANQSCPQVSFRIRF